MKAKFPEALESLNSRSQDLPFFWDLGAVNCELGKAVAMGRLDRGGGHGAGVRLRGAGGIPEGEFPAPVWLPPGCVTSRRGMISLPTLAPYLLAPTSESEQGAVCAPSPRPGVFLLRKCRFQSPGRRGLWPSLPPGHGRGAGRAFHPSQERAALPPRVSCH